MGYMRVRHNFILNHNILLRIKCEFLKKVLKTLISSKKLIISKVFNELESDSKCVVRVSKPRKTFESSSIKKFFCLNELMFCSFA